MEKTETHYTYTAKLRQSEYDDLDVVMAEDGRITMKFNDSRWRTVEDSISILEEMISQIKTLPTPSSN